MVLVAIQLSVLGLYLPPVLKMLNDSSLLRPKLSFRCQSIPPCASLAERARRGACARPTIRARIISATGVHIMSANTSTPDDHFTASPHGRVTASGIGWRPL